MVQKAEQSVRWIPACAGMTVSGFASRKSAIPALVLRIPIAIIQAHIAERQHSTRMPCGLTVLGRPAVIAPVLHHVNLKTTRLTEMIDWYGKVAGFKLVHLAPVGAWLSNDGANHRLALLVAPGLSDDPEKRAHTGLHHTAYEFPSFADLIENYERLRGMGIVPRFCLDHGMTMSMYYADPDMNHLELQADNFGDWAKSSNYMKTSPQFYANPIGVFFDPARVCGAYRSGRQVQELHQAVMAGEYMPDPVPDIGLPPVSA
jgi:catechol 2,3-dioxygenase